MFFLFITLSFSYRMNEDGICLVAWHDNKVISVASTVKGKEPLCNVSRFSRKEKKRINLSCPAAIHHYNMSMGGVDLSDSHVARCRSSIRGKKWYFPLFLYLIDLSIANAWILYRMAGNKCDLASFRADVAYSLLLKNTKGKRVNSAIPVASRFDQKGHMVIYIDKQNRCKECQKLTNFQCKKCDINLHPKHCFLNCHTH